MVLGKLPVTVRYRLQYYLKGPLSQKQTNIVGQGPTAFAVGADGGCLDIFSRLSLLSSFVLSLGDGPI